LSFDEDHGVGNRDNGRDILATRDEPTPSGDVVDADVTNAGGCNQRT